MENVADFSLFIDRLVDEKGLNNLDSSILSQLKVDLAERLENIVNAAILAKMPQDKLESFEKLLDSGNDSEIQSFCAENIPDLDQVIAGELLNFRQTYLGE